MRCVSSLWLTALVVAWAALTPVSADAKRRGSTDEQIEQAIREWNLTEARELLSALDNSPDHELQRAMVDFHAANYTQAAARLQQLLTNDALSGQKREFAGMIASQAEEAAKLFTDAREQKSDDQRIVASFLDDKDVVIAPYLFGAIEQADRKLTREFAVKRPALTRFEILNDPAILAKITNLPITAVYTTGTVGITKYYRVMMVTPRVMLRGYEWIDTAVHEYVHFLVSMRTGDRAPVWLQEGLAKLYENSWRSDDYFEMEEPVAALLRSGLETNTLVTFEEMHPSIAMLPSQERAALAYAQVHTMLALVRLKRGAKGIQRLLAAVESGVDAKSALASAWGQDFDAFEKAWKAELLVRTKSAKAGALSKREFVVNGNDNEPDAPRNIDLSAFSKKAGGRARQLARIGELLRKHGHLDAARVEFANAMRADGILAKDPSFAQAYGELALAAEQYEIAAPLLETASVAEPRRATLAVAAAQAHLGNGKRESATVAAMRAVRSNPFVPQLHCVLARVLTDTRRQEQESRWCTQSRRDADAQEQE